MRDLLIKGDWFEKIINAPEEVQKELFFRVINLGVLENDIEYENDDWAVADAWKNLKGHIVRMKDSHDNQVEYGKKVGRKMTVNPDELYYWAHQGKTAPQIAEILGIKTSGIYENPGWTHRKVEGWTYSKNDSKNENGIPEKNSKNDFGKEAENSKNKNGILEENSKNDSKNTTKRFNIKGEDF